LYSNSVSGNTSYCMFFFDTDVDLLKVAPAYALQEKCPQCTNKYSSQY